MLVWTTILIVYSTQANYWSQCQAPPGFGGANSPPRHMLPIPRQRLHQAALECPRRRIAERVLGTRAFELALTDFGEEAHGWWSGFGIRGLALSSERPRPSSAGFHLPQHETMIARKLPRLIARPQDQVIHLRDDDYTRRGQR